MKILHLLHSLRGGGIQNFLLSLAPEQVSQGHSVTVIVIDQYDSAYSEHLETVLTSNNVVVLRLNKIRGNKWSFIKAVMKCRKLIKKIHPDIVNTHAEISHLYGALATTGTNIHSVITVHNAPELWNMPLKLLCKNKPLIFCSHSAYDLRKQNSSKMIAIDNGISRNIVHSCDITDLRKEFNLTEEDKIIILAGSLRPQKNYHFLMSISDVLNNNNYHFFICGGGKVSEGNIDPLDFKNYKNIHFLGLRSDVSALENGADLFLSCATFEGLPIAVLEAYFNGIPCVLSPIEQHKRIAAVENVWIPDEFTPQSFVKCINEAMSQIDNHDKIYQQRKNQLEQYCISNTVKYYDKFYKEIINESY